VLSMPVRTRVNLPRRVEDQRRRPDQSLKIS